MKCLIFFFLAVLIVTNFYAADSSSPRGQTVSNRPGTPKPSPRIQQVKDADQKTSPRNIDNKVFPTSGGKQRGATLATSAPDKPIKDKKPNQ